MARKKRVSFGEQLVHAVSDVANAASVAATGSEIGILELAAEDGLNSPAVKRPRKAQVVPKKKAAPKKKATPGKKAVRKKEQVVSRKAGRPKRKKRAASRR